MSVLAPSWALSALALDSRNEPHLPPGRHLRVLPSPALGLPLLPLRVNRINLGNPATAPVGNGNSAMWCDTVRCTDAAGNELPIPFNLPADGRVDIWLPAGAVSPTVHVMSDPAQPFTGVAELLAHTAGGEVRVAQRSAAPFTLSSARVEHLRLRGKGRITGVRWVNAQGVALRYSLGAPWRSWSLPLAQPQLFYTPSADALTAAEARAGRGAPLRVPMQQAPQAASPAVAPSITPPVAKEWLRLAASRQQVSGWLPRLVGILGHPHAERLLHNSPSPSGGTDSLDLALPLVEALHLSLLDPGLARWTGLADVDEDKELPTAPGEVIAYVVTGIWQASRSRWWNVSPWANTLAPSVLADNAAFDAEKRLPLARPAQATPPYWALSAVAACAVDVPGGAVEQPFVEALRHRAWLPATPPAARREVVIELGGLVPGPGLAVARQDGGAWQAVNRTRPDQQVLALVPGPAAPTPAPAGAPPGQRGRVLDRQAPAGALSYRAAQCDLFGRWSEWRTASGAAAERPAPPTPQPSVHPDWGQEAAWPASGTMAPNLRINVPVPPPDQLAPGSLPLSALRVQIDNRPAVDTPLGPDDTLTITLPGPALLPCQSVTVSVRAWWLASTMVSPASKPVQRLLHDPRPPAQVVLDQVLAYASRPDATGKSRIDLRWTPPAGQALARVLMSNETVLLSRMRAAIATPANPDTPAQQNWRLALQQALQAIESAVGAPARAAAIVDHAGLYARDWFELLEREPRLQPQAEAGRLVHEVSGQLQTLSLLRVLPVSASNVEADFAGSPMIAFAVPNLLPPPQPLLQVRATGDSALLTLTVPPAAEPAQRYRLRRSRGRTDQIGSMPVVGSGWLPPPAGPGQPQVLQVPDNGLTPWQRYGWRLEVQGADLPGSQPLLQGAWSAASEVVSAQAIPTDPPAPVTQLTLLDNPPRLRFAYPVGAIDGGPAGRFRFVVQHRPAAGLLADALDVLADGPPAAGGLDPQTGLAELPLPPALAPAAGSVYSLVVVDPLGRRSLGNPVVTVQVSP